MDNQTPTTRRGPYKKMKYSEEDTGILDNSLKCSDEETLDSRINDVQTCQEGDFQFELPVNTSCDRPRRTTSSHNVKVQSLEDTGVDHVDNVDVFDVGKLHEMQELYEVTSTDPRSDEDDDDDDDLGPLNNAESDLEMLSDSDFEISDDDTVDMVDDSASGGDDPDMQPLYPGAAVTVGAFMLLLSLFCTKYYLIGDAVQQLLSIIAVALPNENLLCTSVHSFKLFFRNLRNPLIKHYYCSYCMGYIKDQSLQNCPYAKCGRRLNENSKEYFLEMPVDQQVQNLFLQKGFFPKLKERFNNFLKDPPSCTYRDIYDGNLYRSYCENSGPLSFPENISFTLNTDGAPVFKSSKVSVWPIFLVLNELPYLIRMKKENMILAGLWFGNSKPSMGTYLHPFLQSFRKMGLGFECTSPDRGVFTCKAYLMCATADLPARCLLCNSIQYNGAYSCWKCQQPGETAKVGKGHAHVFPFQLEDPKGPLRTHENVINDAQKAFDAAECQKKLQIVHGVKGPSWLTFFPKFDIVDGIAIDYMHGILLGVQKLLLTLWFSAKHKGKPFSYHNEVCKVDKRLSDIRPTLDIGRLPRSIEHESKYWKASEFRSFLLFFGAPVLHGVLDMNRFSHYLLLVHAVHILLKYGSTKSDLDKAETMLFNFCKNFSSLYGSCFMTLNLHQLLHLADSVRCLGPLYTHSCFSFEDKNGILLRMIRGTQNIDNQIITGVSFLQKMPELKAKSIEIGSDLEKLCVSIEHPNILKRGKKLGEHMYVLGAVKTKELSDNVHSAVCDYLTFSPTETYLKSFKRLELNGSIIYGLDYSRMIKRDNSTVAFQEDDKIYFGRVHFFLILENENVVAVVEELHCPMYKNCCILSVRMTENVKIVPVSHIIETCIFVSYQDEQCPRISYVCRFPNRLESE